MKPKAFLKFVARGCLAIALLLNGTGFLAAYFLTHYQSGSSFGVSRSQNYNDPQDFGLTYQTHQIPLADGSWLHSWLIPADGEGKGIVLLFHGKDSNKSSLMHPAKILNQLGYHTLLVDFRGAGRSSGNKTTIGIEEGKDVAAAVDYLSQLPAYSTYSPILYGISMGSAAILEAIANHNIEPRAIILELPFATLLSAVKARLTNSSLPASPMAELIVFWGGVQHGFNGFAHQPIEDAQFVTCPTLILAGESDSTVTVTEVESLRDSLQGQHRLTVFPNAGHNILAQFAPKLWQEETSGFLSSL